MHAVLIGVGALMIAATALPLLRRDAWWIRIFDFPRLQIAALLALTLIAYLPLRPPADAADWTFLGALAIALAYQLHRMRPYTPLHHKQVQPSRRVAADATVSVLFANVLMTNRDAQRLRRLIREHDPDLILAVETDAWWEAQLAEFERTYPYTLKQPQDNTYGMLLFSRLELRDPAVRFLVQDDVPSMHARLLLRVGQEIELRCLHPRPPAPQESDRSTQRDAELLIVGREIRKKQRPAIVLGDLNDVAWSHTSDLFQNISGLLDPRVGRGFYSTFNARWPLVRFPLDHIFHSPHFRLVAFRRLGPIGSDHFPVYAKLSFEPEAQQTQEQPRAAPQEKQEARRKIEKTFQQRTDQEFKDSR